MFSKLRLFVGKKVKKNAELIILSVSLRSKRILNSTFMTKMGLIMGYQKKDFCFRDLYHVFTSNMLNEIINYYFMCILFKFNVLSSILILTGKI